MTRMKYINGERTFSVNKLNTDRPGYYLVTDVDNKAEFYLPDYVVESYTYVFSWDRYKEERPLNWKDAIYTEIERVKGQKSGNKELLLNSLENLLKD